MPCRARKGIAGARADEAFRSLQAELVALRITELIEELMPRTSRLVDEPNDLAGQRHDLDLAELAGT
jgi:hypothetical protein